jgi:general secretion pathway protein L
MPSALQRALTRDISASRSAAALWRWWLDEMRSLVGGVGARLLGVETVIVELDADGWTLKRERFGGAERLPVEPGWRGPVVVEVAPGLALRKTLRLPAAARETLDPLLAFEIGRLTPFAVEQVYHRSEIVGRGAGSELSVSLTVVPCERVDGALDRLATLGFEVAAVSIAGTPALERRRCNLVPGLAPRSALWTPLNRVLAAMLILAGLAAAAAPLIAGPLRGAALERELAELRPLVESARAEQELHAQGAAQREELAAAASGPSMVRLLAALTHALPDGSWLTALAANGREIVIEGLSPSAAMLPQALEAVDGVARVVYAAPITRDPQTGRERFQFTLQLGRKAR